MNLFTGRFLPACLAVLCLLPAGAQAGWRDGFFGDDGWYDAPVPPGYVGRRPVIVYPAPRQGPGVMYYRRGYPVYGDPSRSYYPDEGVLPDDGDPYGDPYVQPRPRRLVKPRPAVTAKLPDTAEPDVVPSIVPPKVVPKAKLTKLVPTPPVRQKPLSPPVNTALPVAPTPPKPAVADLPVQAALPVAPLPLKPAGTDQPLKTALPVVPAPPLPSPVPQPDAALATPATPEPAVIDLPVPVELTAPAVAETPVTRALTPVKPPAAAAVALPVPRPNLEGMDFEAPSPDVVDPSAFEDRR